MTSYLILLYHGVHDDNDDNGLYNKSGKHISQGRFRSEMQHLKNNFPVVTMEQIADAHAGKGRLPDKSVAVTFDDGFFNNYSHAWPVLEEFRIPATFYLATGFIGTGRLIWTDHLEALILGARRPGIEIVIQEQLQYFPLRTPEERLAAYAAIKAVCKNLPNADKDALLASISEAADAEIAYDNPLYRFLDWDDIREMDASPLVSFGAHTVDHVSLGLVSEAEIQTQIDTSLAAVKREIGKEVRLFSYPEGTLRDFNSEVISHLKERGLDHCPTAIAGINTVEDTDPFYLRRTMVGFENAPFPLQGPVFGA